MQTDSVLATSNKTLMIILKLWSNTTTNHTTYNNIGLGLMANIQFGLKILVLRNPEIAPRLLKFH